MDYAQQYPMFYSRTDTIRYYSIIGEISTTYHITRSSSRNRNNRQTINICKERTLVAMSHQLRTGFEFE